MVIETIDKLHVFFEDLMPGECFRFPRGTPYMKLDSGAGAVDLVSGVVIEVCDTDQVERVHAKILLERI